MDHASAEVAFDFKFVSPYAYNLERRNVRWEVDLITKFYLFHAR